MIGQPIQFQDGSDKNDTLSSKRDIYKYANPVIIGLNETARKKVKISIFLFDLSHESIGALERVIEY